MPSVFSPSRGKSTFPGDRILNYNSAKCRISAPSCERTQQASEGNRRRERSEIDEDYGGDALGVQGVLQIADVVWVASPDVVDQTSKDDARTLQRVHLLFTLFFLLTGTDL